MPFEAKTPNQFYLSDPRFDSVELTRLSTKETVTILARPLAALGTWCRGRALKFDQSREVDLHNSSDHPTIRPSSRTCSSCSSTTSACTVDSERTVSACNSATRYRPRYTTRWDLTEGST